MVSLKYFLLLLLFSFAVEAAAPANSCVMFLRHGVWEPVGLVHLDSDIFKFKDPNHINVVKVIVRHHGKIALVRRAEDPDDIYQGMWELPGGHIELGPDGNPETIREAANRETRLETGLILNDHLNLLHRVLIRKNEQQYYKVFMVEAGLHRDSPETLKLDREKETTENGWFDYDHLPPNVIPFIDEYLRWYLKPKTSAIQAMNRRARWILSSAVGASGAQLRKLLGIRFLEDGEQEDPRDFFSKLGSYGRDPEW